MQIEQELFADQIENELAICRHHRAIVEEMMADASPDAAESKRLARLSEELGNRISGLENKITGLGGRMEGR